MLKRIRKRLLAMVMVLTMLLTLIPVTAAAITVNKALTSGTAYSGRTNATGAYVHAINCGNGNPFVQIDYSNAANIRFQYSTDGVNFQTLSSNQTSRIVCSKGASKLYITAESLTESRESYTLKATLIANDENEPNDTEANATVLNSGDTASFSLINGDTDWFAVRTDKDGQDITLTFSGLSSNQLEALSISPGGTGYFYHSWDDSVSFRGGEAGLATFTLEIHGTALTSGSVTVSVSDNDDHEYNDTAETATPIEDGETVDFMLTDNDEDWFAVETTEANQAILLSFSNIPTSGYLYVDHHFEDGSWSSANVDSSSEPVCIYAAQPGEQLFRIRSNSDDPLSASFTVSVQDGDATEPNDSKENACELKDGVKTDFMIGLNDRYDWFVVETTEDAQDIGLTFSGFSYAVQGYFYLTFGDTAGSDSSKDLYEISSNETVWFHAPKAGKYLLRLDARYNPQPLLPLSITAEVADGDSNEPNDTKDTATELPIGTDRHFTLGGWGDEDWFAFEAALDPGESARQYTLRLLGFNTDYSDELRYDVYDPDGNAVVSGAYANIRHSNVLSCTKTGSYTVRIYTPKRERSYDPVFLSRADLRIRVEEGGADPYESNDTWLTAAPVSVDSPIQFILANTSEVDWFRFQVPEGDMTLRMNVDRNTICRLYDADTLQAEGPQNDNDIKWNGYSNYETTGFRWKFTKPGTYYLQMTAGSSYISEELRTMTLTLDPATEEEHNDTWKTAKPLYEGVPQSFTLSAGNDEDWFSLEVSAGTTLLRIDGDSSYWFDAELYRREDFEAAGDNAAEIASDSGADFSLVLRDPKPGTYYVRLDCSSVRTGTLSYTLYTEPVAGDSIANAPTLPEGQWTDVPVDFAYYALGELAAGNEVRFDLENVYYWYLYNSAGELVKEIYCGGGNSRLNWIIPADDSYYVRIDRYSNTIPHIFWDHGTAAAETLTLENLPESLTLELGDLYYLRPRIAPHNALLGESTTAPFYFTTNNSSAVSCDGPYSGWLTANAVGTADITVKVDVYGISCSKTIPVTVVEEGALAPTAIAISGAPAGGMTVGERVQLTASLTPVTATDEVEWSSSDRSVLYVSPGGTVTAVGAGTAAITAAVGDVSRSVSITVTPAAEKIPVTGITLDDYDLTLYAEEEPAKLTATVQPADADHSGIVWKSSNVLAATVDQNGNVTPLAPGITVVSASCEGYSVSCIVTVHAKRVRVESISFSETSHTLPLDGTCTLFPIITPSHATTQNVLWSSSDEGIATVSRTGKVTALGVGTCVITATTVDGSKTASITITVEAGLRKGDVNMDGFVDAGDAILILRYAVELETLTDEQKSVANVNGDSFIDAGDAIRILRYDAQLIDEL